MAYLRPFLTSIKAYLLTKVLDKDKKKLDYFYSSEQSCMTFHVFVRGDSPMAQTEIVSMAPISIKFKN